MLLIALFRYVIVLKLMASRIILIKYVVFLVERLLHGNSTTLSVRKSC